jgi:hypothetical protein
MIPSVGSIVVCHELAYRPHMLVVDVDDNTVQTALLADLAPESIQRLQRGQPEPVVRAVRQAEAIDTYCVPRDHVAPSPALA